MSGDQKAPPRLIPQPISFPSKVDLNDDETRFTVELEFVQSLAHAPYLRFLAENGYFNNPSFLNYLHYLLYWKDPQYVKYINRPYCLFYLGRLQDKVFREQCTNPQFIQELEMQQLFHHRDCVMNQYQLNEPEVTGLRQS
eukprot:TRINITY_DN3865_c0_g1_i1.p1 TRINITY_DN3865_c0_g1~~TRINITY_DN3865_c0_g1_i1.p1  ORF type:complete len:140 (-),score=31.40 TRINITY_DN3865_c0_g1_i1:146-565(-)